ncbi:hypothetical protein Pint_14606 [Pistacia integerrima]|uniref:Uncharacterized protein n=1 Tax=Pistacia integerrima TaxID=434235 RepID=A0ACC0YA09_9ROSI|nr:hypothetical protein Pint_14606 [Pistacia integerrima]
MMISKFNLKPGIKHYGCMVDLYVRAGMLEKALEVISSSPSKDCPVLWRTLLGSCKIHRNVEMGETAMRNLVQLGVSSARDYVLLATIYAASKDPEGVARMRKLIKSQGIKTTPGWSWIEVDSDEEQGHTPDLPPTINGSSFHHTRYWERDENLYSDQQPL